jgi:hypothetical protein
LRYCRSRFFTFLCFMQKLSGISSGKNNKSCRIFHSESNKVGCAFFLFCYYFIWILQESAKWLYYLRCGFAVNHLDFLQIHNRALLLRISPQKFSLPRNVAPGAVAGAARRNPASSPASASERGREKGLQPPRA